MFDAAAFSADPLGYVPGWAWTFRQPPDRGALRLALRTLVADHPALRTALRRSDGNVMARVAESFDPMIELERHGHDCSVDDVIDHAYRDAAARIDIAEGRAVGAAVAAAPDGMTVVVLAAHHAAVDSGSIPIICETLAQGYLGLARSESARAERLEHARAGADPEALRRLVETVDHLCDPLDHHVPGGVSQHRNAGLGADLRLAAARLGVTPFQLGLAAFSSFVERETGGLTPAIGLPVDERRLLGRVGEVGAILNTAVVRLAGRPGSAGTPSADRDRAPGWFPELAERASDALLDALEQGIRFEELCAAVRADGRPVGAVPLTVLYQLRMHDPPELRLGPTTGRPHPVRRRPKVPLEADLRIDGDTLEITLIGTGGVVDLAPGARGAAARFAEHLGGVLSGWVPAEPVVARAVHNLTRRADASAVRDGDVVLSGAGLLSRADGLAGELHRRGVRRGDGVAVVVPRSAGHVVATLAVALAGGWYVPLDPSDPRTPDLLARSGVRFVVRSADPSVQGTASSPSRGGARRQAVARSPDRLRDVHVGFER